MRKLNTEQAEDWSYNDGQGILIAIPKSKLVDVSELYFLTSDKFGCMDVALNTGDKTNGLITGDFKLNLSDYHLILCDDMREFCEWYLKSSRIQVETLVSSRNSKIKEDKEWIHEKCGTNTPPTSVPERRSCGCRKRTRRKRLEEVLTLLEFTHRIDSLAYIINIYYPQHLHSLSIPQHLVDEIAEVKKEMDAWLDEEV